MRTKGERVIFDPSDMAFLKRFGIEDAAQMVLDFKASHKNLPFIFDTFQLADLLRLNRKQLFDLVKKSDRHYRSVTIKKKNGTDRRLHAPDAQLADTQRIILRQILCKLPVSRFATAYIRRRSLKDNAAPHVGKRYVLKMDITDFFGSIRFDQVYSAAFNTKYFPKQIGVMLTTLCCRKDVLPQGAPTSPALSNLVMRNFDNTIGTWCEQREISYTRYCDDMTFSSDQPLFHVYEKVRRILEDMGFEINEKKTHFVTNAARQSVTGLTVNEKLSVSREYKRNLRQEVYYALKFGLNDSMRFAVPAVTENGLPPNETSYYHHLMGKIRYILQIEPDNTWFQNALEQLHTQRHPEAK